jgi:hypothetical protein
MIKNICLCLVAGFILSISSYWLESNYIIDFSKDNLLLLIVALFAIQISSVSFILSRIKEIQILAGGDFTKTVQEIERTVLEQLLVVISTALILIFTTSDVASNYIQYHNVISSTFLSAVLICEILIIWDTAKAVFSLAKFNPNSSCEEKS